MNPWLPLPDDFQQRTDEELGRWLVASWGAFQAERVGIPRSAISPEWIEALIRATVADEVDSVEHAALDSALRKACNGKFERAGAMLRAIVQDGAIEIVKDDLARTGARVRKPFAESNHERSAESSKREEAWQARAADLWAMPQHAKKNNSDIARLIDPEQWNTIRRKIKKP